MEGPAVTSTVSPAAGGDRSASRWCGSQTCSGSSVTVMVREVPAQKSEVISIVPRTGHYGVVPIPDQDHVTITHLYQFVARAIGRIEILQRKAAPVPHAVVVDLIQIDFLRWLMHIVFVRRITRPVATRSVDLENNQLVGRKGNSR